MIDYTNEIKTILRDSTDFTVEEMSVISNDTNIADLGIDSLSLIEAVIEIEKKFKIEIEIGGAYMDEAVISVNDINKLINKKLNG